MKKIVETYIKLINDCNYNEKIFELLDKLQNFEIVKYCSISFTDYAHSFSVYDKKLDITYYIWL